jgi:uncharacterized protein (TIGR03435 family)
MRTESREMLAVGILGGKSRGFESRLGDRIQILLRRGRTFSPRASAAGVAASTVILGGLMFSGSLAPRWIAFAQEQPRASFEIASVKPTPAARRGFDFGTYFRSLPGGRFSAENVPLGMLITKAYGVDSNRIVGGNWLRFGGETYDIEAKADDHDPRFKTAEAAGPAAQQALTDSMLRSLLEDRFKLAVHRETKETSGYALVVAKGGPKLKKATEARPEDGSISAGRGRLTGQRAPLSMLAAQLTRAAGRTVTDETGLEGEFDFNLEWTPEETPTDLSAAPSLFTAIQEQLGLRLEARREKTGILVIDHVEKPDAN